MWTCVPLSDGDVDACPSAGSAPPVNGVIPNMPSPTMSTFSVGAPPASQQPVVSETSVYTNGLPQSYPACEFRCWQGRVPEICGWRAGSVLLSWHCLS